MAAKKRKKFSQVDPGFLERQRLALKRNQRKTILFNSREIEAIDEYCRRFRVSSRSALIRKATMEHIIRQLGENIPTLF